MRGVYNSGSSLCYDSDFYPFGGEKVHTNTCAQNYKFTGLERDAESGLDDTLYRKYSSNFGRWLEVDAKRGCIAHPQGLNRYVYVADNPATFTDPAGLSYCDTHPDSVACNREPRLVEISDLGFISGDLGDLWDFGFDFRLGDWFPSVRKTTETCHCKGNKGSALPLDSKGNINFLGSCRFEGCGCKDDLGNAEIGVRVPVPLKLLIPACGAITNCDLEVAVEISSWEIINLPWPLPSTVSTGQVKKVDFCAPIGESPIAAHHSP